MARGYLLHILGHLGTDGSPRSQPFSFPLLEEAMSNAWEVQKGAAPPIALTCAARAGRVRRARNCYR